jgi:hypothetical protein
LPGASVTIETASPALRKLLDQSNGVRQNGDGWMAFCPAHEDKKNRSFSIHERDGKILVHCFTGCSFESILSALRIDARELFEDGASQPHRRHHEQAEEPEQRFERTDEDVKWMADAFDRPECLAYLERRGVSLEVAQKLRWGFTRAKFQDTSERQPALATPHYVKGKLVGVKYRTIDNSKRFTQDVGSAIHGLYAGDLVDRKADEVFVFEGPEDVALALTHRLNACGIVSASGKLGPEDVGLLSTYRNIHLIGDNDRPGQEAMNQIAAQLPRERVFRLALPGFKDIGELWQSDPDAFETNFHRMVHAQWRGMFHSLADFENAPPISFAIKDFLQNDGATLIGGLSAHGKTLIMLSMAKALLVGPPTKMWGYFDVLEKASRVIYLIPESSIVPFKHRLKLFGLYDSLSDDRLLVRTLSLGPTPRLSDARILLAAKGAHVFLDTAVRFSVEGSENDAGDNQRGLASDIFALLGAGARTVVGAHHSPKPFAKENTMRLENILRGTGDIGAMVATCWGIKQLDACENIVHIENVKPRDFQPPQPFQLIGRPYITDEGDFRMHKKPTECGSLMDEQQPGRDRGGASSLDRERRAANIALLRGWLKDDPGLTSEEVARKFRNEGIEIGRSTVRKYKMEIEK